MANEAVLKIETHIPINFTCSTTVTIEKGAIVKLTDPMTAVLSDGINDLVAGIVQSEKLSADTTQNSVAVFRGGFFRVSCSGTCNVGKGVITATGGLNKVQEAVANQENILGIMMETGTDGQNKIMELRPTTMDLN